MTFFPFPAWLASRPDVSWGGKVLFAVLLRYTRRGTREAYPAVETLVSDMGASRRTVERWLAELEHVGLLDRVRTGRACTYRMAAEPPEVPAILGASEPGTDTVKTDASDPPPPAHLIRQQVAPLIRQQVADQASRTPSSVGVEISVEGARPQAEISLGEGRDRIAKAWRVGYCRRFEAACSVAPSPPGGSHLVELIDRALSQKDPDAYVTAGLDGFFADEWARTRRYPIANLAKNADRYAAAVTEPPKARRLRSEDPDKYRPAREWAPPVEGRDNVVPIADAARALLASVGLKAPGGGT